MFGSIWSLATPLASLRGSWTRLVRVRHYFSVLPYSWAIVAVKGDFIRSDWCKHLLANRITMEMIHDGNVMKTANFMYLVQPLRLVFLFRYCIVLCRLSRALCSKASAMFDELMSWSVMQFLYGLYLGSWILQRNWKNDTFFFFRKEKLCNGLSAL